MFMHVFDCYKTSKMFDKAVKKDSKMFKTHKMCEKVVKNQRLIINVPDQNKNRNA